MQIHAILNAKAGTLLDRDPQEVANAVEARLRQGGHEVTIELVQPQEIGAAMDRAIASGPDTLVVGGGDGTIKAAAEKLAGTDTALGIIPLGTINLLARDLHIPFDPEEAAAALSEGKRRAIDVAEVNGHIFLCSSLLGLPIKIAEQRQALRGLDFGERLGRYWSIVHDFLSNRRRFEIEVDDGQYPRRVRAMSIAISNNPLSETAGTIPTRRKITGGQLALYLSKHETGGAMGWSILQRMLGRWRPDPEIEEFCASSITLRSSREKVRASNDGEIEELETPLKYSIRPLALNVIAPEPAQS